MRALTTMSLPHGVRPGSCLSGMCAPLRTDLPNVFLIDSRAMYTASVRPITQSFRRSPGVLLTWHLTGCSSARSRAFLRTSGSMSRRRWQAPRTSWHSSYSCCPVCVLGTISCMSKCAVSWRSPCVLLSRPPALLPFMTSYGSLPLILTPAWNNMSFCTPQ